MTATPNSPDCADATEPVDAPDAGNREAARYRTRLREVEAERDQLLGVVTGYRRSEVEKAAEDAGLVRGSDLFDLGANMDDLMTDGTVDPEKVGGAVAAVLKDRPHWAKPAPGLDLGMREVVPAVRSSGWSEVLRAAPRSSGWGAPAQD